MSDEPKKDEQAPEVKTEPSGESLPEADLEQVAGGKLVDANSTILFLHKSPTPPPAK
jgi:hypothetical protein